VFTARYGLIPYTGRFIMYSGITKMYYRKTVGHVFTKPAQREGTAQKKFPVSCFSSQFTFLPLVHASVCSEKMAAAGKKSFCVLEYHTNKSVVTVQCAFRAKYAKDPPTNKTICAWYKQCTETGCLCKQKAPMLTRVWQEDEYRVDVVHTSNISSCQEKKKNFSVSCGCEQFH